MFESVKVRWYLSELKDSRSDVRRSAAEALVKLGSPAVKPLIAALQDSDSPYVRESAADALGKLGDARAVEPLITALEDSSVRESAAEALGKLGDARAVEPLIAALKDSDKYMRRTAAWALGKLGDARAIEPLIAALQDTDEVVRKLAAEALGKLGDARVMEPLLTACQNSNFRIRREAVQMLERFGDARTVEPLIRALQDTDEDVRQKAAEALGKLGDARAVEPLVAAFKTYPYVEAARALGRLGRGSWAVNTSFEELRKSATEMQGVFLSCLAILLEVAAQDISTKKLKAIVALPGTVSWGNSILVHEANSCNIPRGIQVWEGTTESRETYQVRQLARQELARRESGDAHPSPPPTPARRDAQTITVNCSHCGGVFCVEAKDAGRSVCCPGCQGPIVIPMK